MGSSQSTVLDRLSALAEPIRARILLLLERNELTVGELCLVLQLPQSTVSRHLKLLTDDGWLVARGEGRSFVRDAAPVCGARRGHKSLL